MRRVASGMLGGLLILALVGCASYLDDATSELGRAAQYPPEQASAVSGVQPLSFQSTVSVPGTVSGSLYGAGHVGIGDWAWYQVLNISAGDKLAVKLEATGNFDVGIMSYVNGQWQWDAQDNSRYITGSPKVIVSTVVNPQATWIRVAAWESNGDFTLTVGTKTTVRKYFEVNLAQLIPQFEYRKIGTFTLYELMDVTIGWGQPQDALYNMVEDVCEVLSKVSDALAFNPSWFPDEQFEVYCWTVWNYYVEGIPISCFFFPEGWVKLGY